MLRVASGGGMSEQSERPRPPAALQRRNNERMALELAGLCLGLIEERFELA